MKKKLLAVAAAIATLPAAYAVDFKAGNWDLSLGGNANAFYTATSCSGDTVTGTALGGKALGCSGNSKSTTIGNGLLPQQLNFGAKTNQEGYDIAAVFGISAAIATNSAIATTTTWMSEMRTSRLATMVWARSKWVVITA